MKGKKINKCSLRYKGKQTEALQCKDPNKKSSGEFRGFRGLLGDQNVGPNWAKKGIFGISDRISTEYKLI
jgi:hypothetical protein